MLTSLSIRNFAIIDLSEVELQQGLTVITGETGAGKSILLKALGLLLGERADNTIIRHGSDTCEVNAEFDLSQQPHVQEWLLDQDLLDESDDPTNCLVRRVIKREKAGKSYINGRPVTLALLKTLGQSLIDLHSQHEHQSLLRKTTQQRIVDDAVPGAEHKNDLAKLGEHYQVLKDLQQRAEQSAAEAADVAARIDLLTFQVNELEQLEIQENEFTELESELKRLSHAQELKTGYSQALHQLNEGEQPDVESLLGNSIQQLDALSEYDTKLPAIIELLNSALANVQEAGNDLRHAAEASELDPERLQWVEQRVNAMIELARKHRCSENQLASHLEQMQQELEQLTQQANPEAMAEQLASAEKRYQTVAKRVSKARQKAAASLSSDITEQMQHLGMQGGEFSIQISALSDGQTSSNGNDSIEFTVTTNPGSPLQALTRTASGGELSRISLAIQVISSQTSHAPTLIFDEVDVGIGGGIAEVVGQRLKALALRAQVLCITHLPQVAAQGLQHLLVRKQTDSVDNSTASQLLNLTDGQRTQEIARMLGGVDITEKTLAHAREMLQQAG